jgi:hypothetical protein
MSTSEYEYRVLVDPAIVLGSTNALDSRTSRILMSNFNHLADEFAQVPIAMSGTVPALSGKSGYLTTGTPALTGTPYAVGSWTFPIKVRASGQSYRFRVRIGGASGNTASTTFYLTLSNGRPSRIATATDDSVFKTDATTSSTAAWLTGDSLGPLASATLMEMTGEQVEACTVVRSTLTTAGGNAVSVDVALVTATVWATTADVTHVPRLYAVYLAEVIGT